MTGAMGGGILVGLVLWLLCCCCSAHCNRTYTKFHSGRHVCSSQRDLAKPVRVTQTFPKPSFKPYSQRCQNNQICQGVRFVYETVVKDVYKTKSMEKTTFVCCPGWTQHSKVSYGCNKSLCRQPCANGGTCTGPQVCACPPGFSGNLCQDDVNECALNKPCDHFCFNTVGSFYCRCKDTFALREDNQSCAKDDVEKTAFEAEDLDFELLDKRIYKLEKMMGTDGYTDPGLNIVEMKTKLENVIQNIAKLENKVHDLEYKGIGSNKIWFNHKY